MKTHYQQIPAFITRNSSLVCELMQPAFQGCHTRQNLLDAIDSDLYSRCCCSPACPHDDTIQL